MVRTHNIAKHFFDPKRGEIRAVDGVTIETAPGKILGLLGSNGAGKTTLLRMLSTVIRPTSGTAEVAGYNVVENPQQVRASIGFMSNTTALYGRSTAREMIEYFAKLYGHKDDYLKQRVQKVIDKF